MDTLTKLLLVFVIALVAAVAFLGDLLGDTRKERDSLTEKLSAQQVINATTLTAVAAYHRVSLDNISAKQTEAAEHVKVKTVIKTVLKGSDCAATPVPAGVVGRLQQYERDIRSRSGGSDSGSTDR